ncbi:DUF6361 family protein [Caloramator australicus]|uniref:Uncharacterized protein n=1 Tax=Caloramator australicus RC3 TaxID=857293 RepID=I7J654_9CLOT|nr:DUF6361 family protein [Caloramator australicus]CCJ34302.1 hypothetical protein CAAU_2218 [Caloramator australicus RC3]
MPNFLIDWVDFSKEQRKRVLDVINLLTEPGAVDELGVGVIRDAFSDIFFPGTSTIQTRAKYFLITGYILKEIEKLNRMTPEKFIEKLHDEELSLIDVLKRSGETGVIGQESGKRLKRKPSDIYWNGIKTYGIFTDKKMSIYDYAKVICRLNERKEKTKSLGKKKNEDDEDADDKDAELTDGYIKFWNLPYFPDNWRENILINLTKEEAEFLKEAIIKSCSGTMLAYILKNEIKGILDIKSFDELEGIINLFPDDIKKDFFMARDFANFIYGAHIRYNVILSNGEDERVDDEWEIWKGNIKKFAEIDINSVIARCNVKNRRLVNFLYNLKDAMLNEDIEKLDKIIIEREKDLKGPKRAKLLNKENFIYKGWVGIDKLQYRFPNARRIIEDIFNGLGGEDV